MPPQICILVVEDRSTDAEILIHEVRRAGFDPEWHRVETEAEFLAGLANAPDLILSDYSLPHFDGLRAVRLLRERGLDTPFILVSGTLGEEAAVEAMKLGVDDYLLKDRLVRLGEAIRHVLEDKRLRDERKQAEAALRESEERFRSTFEQAAVGMAHVSTEGRFLRVNDKLCAIVGYAREELLELSFADLTLPEHLAESLEASRAMVAGEQATYSTEKRYRRRGGEGVWLKLVTTLERTPAREPRYFISVFVDITERKQAEEMLCKSEERYRRLIETANEGIWTIDTEGRTTYVNQRMADLLGYTAAEIMGRIHTDFMWEEDRPKGELELELRRQGLPHVWDQRYRRKDDSELWTVASCNALFDVDGTFIGALGMFTDITVRRQAEQKVAEQLAELRRWQAVMLDRTDRSMELKREVNALLLRLGEPVRYPSQAPEAPKK